jgi:hypothetical protein
MLHNMSRNGRSICFRHLPVNDKTFFLLFKKINDRLSDSTNFDQKLLVDRTRKAV